MSGEIAGAKTGVFWDVDDCPITGNLNPNLIYKNIKAALVKEGFSGNVELKAYSKDESFRDEYLLDAGMTYVPKVAEHLREMSFDVFLWAHDNPSPSNVLVIAKYLLPRDGSLCMTLGCLDSRNYNVLLAIPEEEELPIFFTPPRVWLWTSLSLGGTVEALSSKGELSAKQKNCPDNVNDSEN